MNFIRREREWQHTFRLPLYSQQLHSQSGALPDFPPFKSDFSTWSKFWVYVHSMCTFQTTFLRIRRMQVKHSPIPRLLPTFSLLPYYKQQLRIRLWWWPGNEAVMVAWEWGCDGGLGIRLWLWSGNKAVMVVWKWGCDGGLGLKQELLVTTVRVYIKKCTLAHPVLWTNGNINTS